MRNELYNFVNSGNNITIKIIKKDSSCSKRKRRNSYEMVVRDEGEKNKRISRSKTDYHSKLSDADSG